MLRNALEPLFFVSFPFALGFSWEGILLAYKCLISAIVAWDSNKDLPSKAGRYMNISQHVSHSKLHLLLNFFWLFMLVRLFRILMWLMKFIFSFHRLWEKKWCTVWSVENIDFDIDPILLSIAEHKKLSKKLLFHRKNILNLEERKKY